MGLPQLQAVFSRFQNRKAAEAVESGRQPVPKINSFLDLAVTWRKLPLVGGSPMPLTRIAKKEYYNVG